MNSVSVIRCWGVRSSVCVHLLKVVLSLAQNRLQLVSCYMEGSSVFSTPQHVASTLC